MYIDKKKTNLLPLSRFFIKRKLSVFRKRSYSWRFSLLVIINKNGPVTVGYKLYLWVPYSSHFSSLIIYLLPKWIILVQFKCCTDLRIPSAWEPKSSNLNLQLICFLVTIFGFWLQLIYFLLATTCDVDITTLEIENWPSV